MRGPRFRGCPDDDVPSLPFVVVVLIFLALAVGLVAGAVR